MKAAGPRTAQEFEQLVSRLSTASVRRATQVHVDIPWDDPDHLIDPHDHRWELGRWDPLRATDWYRSLAPEDRSTLGLCRSAGIMKVGIEFESGLQQGLLGFASELPDGDPSFRYAYHEIAEEAQHSMMFQEFIDRSGQRPDPQTELFRDVYAGVARMGREFPALFFLSVLSGEEPIDYVQRKQLAEADLHPLLRRINQIHCNDEARHLSFARAFLRTAVPALDPKDFRRLQYQAPAVVGWAARHMLEPPTWLLDRWHVPEEVREELSSSAQEAQMLRHAAAKNTSLCRSLGILEPRLEAMWTRQGLL